MKNSLIKITASGLLALMIASCASPQDQFGYAVKHGNIQMAKANMGHNYANMRVYETPQQYSVPMQFAIIRKDVRMADFLLDNGAHRTLDGRNLAYYSAINGNNDMAQYFVSRGIGSRADIHRAARERAEWQRRERQNSEMAGVIALGALAAMMSSGGGSGNSGEAPIYVPWSTEPINR